MKLRKIATSPWFYVLYQAENGKYYGDVCVGNAAAQAMLYFMLTDEETKSVEADPKFMDKLADMVAYAPGNYITRKLNRNDFQFE